MQASDYFENVLRICILRQGNIEIILILILGIMKWISSLPEICFIPALAEKGEILVFDLKPEIQKVYSSV